MMQAACEKTSISYMIIGNVKDIVEKLYIEC